jgi:hypothetical protein
VATRDLFDKAQKCILLLMQTDSLTAFFRSPLYRRHLKDKEAGVSLMSYASTWSIAHRSATRHAHAHELDTHTSTESKQRLLREEKEKVADWMRDIITEPDHTPSTWCDCSFLWCFYWCCTPAYH